MTPNFLFSWPHAVMGGGELDSGQTSGVLTAEDCSSCLYDDGVILPHQTQQVWVHIHQVRYPSLL